MTDEQIKQLEAITGPLLLLYFPHILNAQLRWQNKIAKLAAFTNVSFDDAEKLLRRHGDWIIDYAAAGGDVEKLEASE
jgi:hypothetical protein